MQIVREYHHWDSCTRTWLTIEEDRPAICLLPGEMADALRAQVVVQGTTHQGEVKALEGGDVDPEDLGPFEFGEAWAGRGARPTAWKALQLDVAMFGPGLQERGSMTSDWTLSAKKHLNGVLSHNAHAHDELRKSASIHRHPDVRKLVGGDIIKANGKDLLVISNKIIHQSAPYPVVIACPLINGSDIDRQTPGAIFFESARIGWELSQRIELAAIPFKTMPVEQRVPSVLVDQVRSAAMRLWTGATPTGVAPPTFINSLKQFADERDRVGLSHQMAPLRKVEVLDFAFHGRRAAHGTGHFSDGIERGVLPGEELFEIETDSPFLVFSIMRKGSDVSAIVETNELDGDAILYALVTDEAGDEVAGQGQTEILSNHGVAELTIGSARAGESLVRTIEVATTHGQERVQIDLTWALS